METPASDTKPQPKNADSSWGDVIAILIIIGILAYGAYYVFTDRISSLPEAQAAVSR